MNAELKDGADKSALPQTWRYRTREGREVELVNLVAAPMPGFVTGTRKDTGEEWTVAVGKLQLANPKLETPNPKLEAGGVANSEN